METLKQHCVACAGDIRSYLGDTLGEQCVKSGKHVCGVWCRPYGKYGPLAASIASGCRCEKGFPFPLSPGLWSQFGFWEPKRLTPEDQMMEPTSPVFWYIFRIHLSFRPVNCSYNLACYLFSYILKSRSLLEFKLSGTQDAMDNLFRTVYTTPSWAIMRLLGDTPVDGLRMVRVKVHVENQNFVVADKAAPETSAKQAEKSLSLFEVYMLRPLKLRSLTFEKFAQQYTVSPSRPDTESYDVARCSPVRYLVRRPAHSDVIVRERVPYVGSEEFYLHLLAREFPNEAFSIAHTTGFSRLRLGKTSYREAAKAKNLWAPDTAGFKHLDEAAKFGVTASRLRTTAATLIAHGALDGDSILRRYLKELAADLTVRDLAQTYKVPDRPLTDHEKRRLILAKWGEYFLSRHNKLASDYGLPDVSLAAPWVETFRAKFTVEAAKAALAKFESEIEAENPDAFAAFKCLKTRIDSRSTAAEKHLRLLQSRKRPGSRSSSPPLKRPVPRASARANLNARPDASAPKSKSPKTPKGIPDSEWILNGENIIDVDAPPGTGKTHLANGCDAYATSMELILPPSCHTGAATQHLRRARTNFTTYGLLVRATEDDSLQSPLTGGRKALLQEADCYLMDECSQTSVDEFLAMSAQVNDAHGVPAHLAKLVFSAGKLVILLGDFRQILPILHARAIPREVYQACLRSMSIWKNIVVPPLTKAVRYKDDRLFLYSKQCGEGLLNDAQEMVPIPDWMKTFRFEDRAAWRVGLTSLLAQFYERSYFQAVHRDVAAGGGLTPETLDLGVAVSRRLYLAPHVTTCAAVNDAVKLNGNNAMLPGEIFRYVSETQRVVGRDHPEPPAGESQCNAKYNELHISGGLPGVLKLKIGSLVSIAALHLNDEAMRSTLGIVTDLADECICIKLIKDLEQGQYRKTLPVPRVRQYHQHSPPSEKLPSTFLRRNYPLYCAWARTVDSAEGSTADAVLLDVLSSLFSHGHYPVGLTRSRYVERFGLVCYKTQRRVYNPVNRHVFPRISAGALATSPVGPAPP